MKMLQIKHLFLLKILILTLPVFANGKVDSALVTKRLNSIENGFYKVNSSIVNTIEKQLFADKTKTEELLTRSTALLPIVSKEINSNHLPLALQYLPAAVSEYNKFSITERGVGIWNLPYIIGRKYGLQINHDIDERRDIVKSTDAALLYLKDLQSQYNNWYLSIFAFVSSPSELNNQIKAYQDVSFGSIYSALNENQQKYYNQFVSAAYVYNFYSDYQLTKPVLSARTATVSVVAENSISIKKLLNQLNIKEVDFLSYNLSLRGNNIPKGFEFQLPTTKINEYENLKDSMLTEVNKNPSYVLDESPSNYIESKPKEVPIAPKSNDNIVYYKVKSGDTVWGICKKYGISESKLKAHNNFKGNNILVGQTLKIVK